MGYRILAKTLLPLFLLKLSVCLSWKKKKKTHGFNGLFQVHRLYGTGERLGAKLSPALLFLSLSCRPLWTRLFRPFSASCEHESHVCVDSSTVVSYEKNKKVRRMMGRRRKVSVLQVFKLSHKRLGRFRLLGLQTMGLQFLFQLYGLSNELQGLHWLFPSRLPAVSEVCTRIGRGGGSSLLHHRVDPRCYFGWVKNFACMLGYQVYKDRKVSKGIRNLTSVVAGSSWLEIIWKRFCCHVIVPP